MAKRICAAGAGGAIEDEAKRMLGRTSGEPVCYGVKAAFDNGGVIRSDFPQLIDCRRCHLRRLPAHPLWSHFGQAISVSIAIIGIQSFSGNQRRSEGPVQGRNGQNQTLAGNTVVAMPF